MLIISVLKHSTSQTLFQFHGPAGHIDVARKALELVPDTQWIDVPARGLIVSVSPVLIDAILSLHAIEAVDGVPFVPIFLPQFGLQNHEGAF